MVFVFLSIAGIFPVSPSLLLFSLVSSFSYPSFSTLFHPRTKLGNKSITLNQRHRDRLNEDEQESDGSRMKERDTCDSQVVRKERA